MLLSWTLQTLKHKKIPDFKHGLTSQQKPININNFQKKMKNYGKPDVQHTLLITKIGNTITICIKTGKYSLNNEL